jgi:hypothetical protein
MRLGLCMCPDLVHPQLVSNPKFEQPWKAKGPTHLSHVFKELTLTNLFFPTYTPLHVFKELTSTKNVFFLFGLLCGYYVPRMYYVQVLGRSHFSGLGGNNRQVYMYNRWHTVLNIRDLVLTLDRHLEIIVGPVWIVDCWVLNGFSKKPS